jgi:hypothetical protein
MDFTNYKYKLIASVAILTAEKDRIKEIITAYNIRLDNIFIAVSSLLDDLEKINFIEKIPEEKERIINLINFVSSLSNMTDDKQIKKSFDEKFKKIDEIKNKGLDNNNINLYSNKFNEIKNVCSNPLKKTEAENIINEYESATTTDEDNTGEEIIYEESTQPNKYNNNDDSNLKNVGELNINMNNNVNNNKNIDEKQKKRDEINKRRREKNLVDKLKKQKEAEAKEREHNNKLLIKL